MAEYSRLAKGTATVLAAGGTAPIYLPFQPDYVEFVNFTAQDTPTATWIVKGWWDSNMGQAAATFDFFDAGPVYSSGSTTTNGISTFSAGLMFQFGASQVVGGITKASPAIVTVTGHGYTSGDVVIFQNLYETAVTGMPQIDGIPFTVTVIDANTFSIPWNTNQTNYTAITGAATGLPTVKKILYPYMYAPGVNIVTAITLGATTTIDTTSAHNFVVGQEVAFRIPSSWGTIQLNSLPNTIVPGSPIYGYVIAVTDYNTVVVNINSTAYTAFNSNQTVASVPGLTFPQIVAVGDVNTGGVPISVGSALYPPPFTRPIGNTTVNSINGPAIQGAFFNNTRQGFVIGSALAVAAQSGQTIFWRAYLHDLSIP